MASQVLSGSGSLSYTNNTGENVRVIINYLGWNQVSGFANAIVMAWGAGSASIPYSSTLPRGAIGRNLAYARSSSNAYSGQNLDGNNAFIETNLTPINFTLPTEVMLAPNATFSVSPQTTGTAYPNPLAGYNLVVIPEGG